MVLVVTITTGVGAGPVVFAAVVVAEESLLLLTDEVSEVEVGAVVSDVFAAV